MGRKSEAQKYFEQFVLWKQKKIQDKDYVIKSRKQKNGEIREYKLTKKELESFEQCYTADETAPYYQARKKLPKFWFISTKGTLITCKYNEPKWIPPTVSGQGNNKREQYEISSRKNNKKSKQDGMCLDPSTLVALTFGGRATIKAEALINQFGLLALKQGKETVVVKDKNTGKNKTVKKKTKAMVELNHEEGYNHGNGSRAELEKYRPYNCDLKRIQFESTDQHNFITNMTAIDKITEKSTIKGLNEVSDITSGEVPTIVKSNGDKSGTIIEGADRSDYKLYTDEEGKLRVNVGGQELIIADILGAAISYKVNIHLLDDNRKELECGKDIEESVYNSIMEMLKDVVSKYNYPLNTIYHLGHTQDKELYWMITEATE